MRRVHVFATFIAAFLAASPAVADVTTYNTAPTIGYQFGSGNDYTPANAAVLDFNGDQLALRMHETFVPAAPSDAAGVYSFALGTQNISFDFAIDQAGGALTSTTLTLTNLLTGQTASYDPLCPVFIGFCVSDNESFGTSTQNSERLSFFDGSNFFFGDIGFDPNVNDTYSVNLTGTDAAGAPHSLTVYAQVGAGATGTVPEPATWAMMLMGFAGIGFALRRQKRNQRLIAQLA
jgi:hypothetical protein